MNPAEAMSKLDAYATELDTLSKNLADLDRALEPIEDEYTRFLEDFEIGLWEASQQGGNPEGPRLPSEALRRSLGHRAMPPELLGRYSTLKRSRSRMEQRLRDLKAAVDAQRSILSALKTEMEATR